MPIIHQDHPDNRSIRLITTLDTPVSKIWEAWTNPKHLPNWWAPAGFTTTVHHMLVQEGEEWRLTLHGPDGKNYPNKSIFREVIPFKKIVYEHFNPDFISTVIFDEKSGKTQMEWSSVFPTPEMFDIVIRTFKADEGQKQNVEKLEAYLMQM